MGCMNAASAVTDMAMAIAGRLGIGILRRQTKGSWRRLPFQLCFRQRQFLQFNAVDRKTPAGRAIFAFKVNPS
jgi:hypothetical protein